MSPSLGSAAPPTSRSFDTLMSQFLSAQGIKMLLLKNPRARYALFCALAALAAGLVEMRRRSHNQDEVKRRIPHRRNSAVHLYDGNVAQFNPQLMARIIRNFCAVQKF